MGYALTSFQKTSYTPTVTGFSSTTSTVGEYILIGKLCICTIEIVGTSNATGFTLTLPFISDPATLTQFQQAVVRGVNNGAGVAGWMRTRAGSSNILDVYSSVTGGTWTASGTKAISCTFIYYIE